MTTRNRPPRNKGGSRSGKQPPVVIVESLLDAMQDGNEYGSIVGVMPTEALDLVTETARALDAISTVRCRPCLAYLGNVVRQDAGDSGVDSTDDLPFAEMVNSIPSEHRTVDVLLSTRGGSAQQVARFVNCLRTRFDEVDFLIPSMCMSAGTLFALSGDHIWMTAQACLGPTDPQIPTKDGRYVPAQALLLLVDKLQRDGAEAMANGQPVPWTAVRIIDTIDKKELGDAITASNYSSMMVAQFLQQYKFRHWLTRRDSGTPVTEEYRRERAEQIAAALASHDRWKSHGHSISRDVLWDEIKLKIDHPDPTLDRALTRA
ncbi:MAG: hypothetical protein M5U22_20560 [Thermoleophilia bacterium]|nr:hypothetical protein [Thermoleophilia bacterium]